MSIFITFNMHTLNYIMITIKLIAHATTICGIENDITNIPSWQTLPGYILVS